MEQSGAVDRDRRQRPVVLEGGLGEGACGDRVGDLEAGDDPADDDPAAGAERMVGEQDRKRQAGFGRRHGHQGDSAAGRRERRQAGLEPVAHGLEQLLAALADEERRIVVGLEALRPGRELGVATRSLLRALERREQLHLQQVHRLAGIGDELPVEAESAGIELGIDAECRGRHAGRQAELEFRTGIVEGEAVEVAGRAGGLGVRQEVEVQDRPARQPLEGRYRVGRGLPRELEHEGSGGGLEVKARVVGP